MKYMTSLFIFLLLFAQSTFAFIVYDPSNYAENVLTAKNSVTSLANQTRAIQQQLQQLQYQLRNTRSVSDYQWRNISSLINRLNQLTEQGQALSASNAAIDSQFRQRYPNYGAAHIQNNYASQYHQWNTTTLDTLRGTLDAAGLTTQGFSNEQALIQQLKSQGQQAQGRMQVLQVSSELAAENVNQLQELKRLMVNQSNAQNTYMAYQVSKASFQEKSAEELANNTDSEFPSYHNHPQFALMPQVH